LNNDVEMIHMTSLLNRFGSVMEIDDECDANIHLSTDLREHPLQSMVSIVSRVSMTALTFVSAWLVVDSVAIGTVVVSVECL